MKDTIMLKTGVAGSLVAALCCATPLLVIVLGALGLSAWLVWLDYVLIPALVAFLGLAAYGFWRGRQSEACRVGDAASKPDRRR